MTSIRVIIAAGAAFAAGELTVTPAEASAATASPNTSTFLVYYGTYTGGKSQGIYVSRFNAAEGTLTTPELAAKTVNPSFLAVHPNGRFLYAVGEVGGGSKQGGVSGFAINAATGTLSLLNQQSSGGAGPCHLTVDPTGQCVLVANYGGGSIAALPLREGGRLGEATAFIQHHGSSVNPQRQSGPHAHGIYTDAANRFVFVPDLGLDQVKIYRFVAEQGKLQPHDPPAVRLAPGAGPRHFAFRPDGRFAYVINELASAITVFAYAADAGTLTERQTISTLPEDFNGRSTTAEVAVHPSGKFVYGSNRGHDSIAVFAVAADTGKLTLVQHESTGGKTPRNFTLDPVGRWLLAANQGTDNVVVFRVDPATGRLTPTGREVRVGSPVCVVFVPSRRS